MVLQLHSNGLLADIANEADRGWLQLPVTLGPRIPVYRITGAAMGDAVVSFQPERTPSTLSANSNP